jgi:hypothetical protein
VSLALSWLAEAYRPMKTDLQASHPPELTTKGYHIHLLTVQNSAKQRYRFEVNFRNPLTVTTKLTLLDFPEHGIWQRRDFVYAKATGLRDYLAAKSVSGPSWTRLDWCSLHMFTYISQVLLWILILHRIVVIIRTA